MKKVLYAIAAVALTVFAASCAREVADVQQNGDLVEVSFNVAMPNAVATKAISDGETAKKLEFRVYDAAGKHLTNLDQTVDVNGKQATVNVKLVGGLEYKFVFWAQKAGQYTIAEDGTITLVPAGMMNSDDWDAFYAQKTMEVTAAFNESITLTRPFAQINVGAVDGDLQVASDCGIDLTTLTSKYIVSKVNTKLNLLDGTVSTPEENVEFTAVKYPAAKIKVGETDYDHVAMLYVLAGEKETVNVDLKLQFKQNGVDKEITRTVPNTPIQRNYRTNILGNIFTVGGVFTITVDNDFKDVDEYNNDYVPEYATIADLNAAFAAGKAIGYNVAVTTPANGTIVLPKTADEVRIFLRGDFSNNTVSIAYADGATASEKPANLYITAPKLKELKGDLASTHVEIVTSSNIETGELTTSNGTLVIQPNAYMGILTVKGGSLKVEGEVEKATIKLAAAEAGSTVTKEDEGEIIELVIEKGTVVVNGEYEKVTATSADASVSVPTGSVVNNLTAVSGSHVDVDGNVDVVVATGDGTVVDLSNAGEIGTITEDGKATVITDPSFVSANVAAIGETEYATLAEAVAAASEGAETTIKILNNTAIIGNAGITIPATKNIVIDLNGFTVSNRVNENKGSQLFTNKGTLTLKNTAATEGTVTNAVLEGTQAGEWWSTPQYNYATNVITNTGTLNIEDGVVVNQTASGSICYAVDNNSTSFDAILNVKGGTLTSVGTVVRQFCNSTTKKNEVNVSGGEITTEGSAALWIQLPGSSAQKKMAALNVTGGTLKGKNYAFYDYSYGDLFDNTQYNLSGGKFVGGVFSYGANISITGGEFSSYVVIKQTQPSTVLVAGGTFGDEVYTYGDNASTGFITGGTFKVNPVEFVKTPSYCVYTNDEEYIVLPSSAAIPAGYYAIIADGIIFDGNKTYTVEGNVAGAIATVYSDAKTRGIADFTIKLPEGEFNLSSPVQSGATIHINGEGADTKLVLASREVSYDGAVIDFSNLTMVGDTNTDFAQEHGLTHLAKETYTNVTFTKFRFFYAAECTLNNCKFVQDAYDYAFCSYGTKTMVLNDCEISCVGKAAKIYGVDAANPATVTFNRCKFSADGSARESAGKDWKAALEIDARADVNTHFTVNVNNTVGCTGFYTSENTAIAKTEANYQGTLYNVDNGSGSKIVVNIDGVQETQAW